MAIITITSLNHPGIEVFATLTEAQLRNRLEPEKGVFIVESPKVIRVALDQGYEPLSLLCENRHIEGDAADTRAALRFGVQTRRRPRAGNGGALLPRRRGQNQITSA